MNSTEKNRSGKTGNRSSDLIPMTHKAKVTMDLLPPGDQKTVARTINALAKTPGLSSPRILKLRSVKDYYMTHAGRKFRVIFSRDKKNIKIVDIVNHDLLNWMFTAQ
ncbi:MAG: hypothetical protein NTX50_22635 [Candidatus Sumerlaeota bacterium]|nr:hypothetical protein [Candidatus Sumerlaeota bacterium]